MDKKILVLATGAIGSCIGADLTRAGRDVILADQWPAHVEAMKTSGVRTITKAADENTAVKAVHLCEIFGLKQMFDLVLLTAKSYDSVWLTHLIKPHLKPDGLFVSIQNSLNDELTAPIVGHERNIACVVELSAEIFEPGIVKRNTDRTRTWFAVGELHGRITPRLQELSTLLSDVGKADMTTNIWGAKWSKLAVNCMTQSPVGILGIHEWEAAAIPSLFDLCIKLGRECLQVGSTLGYTMEPIFGLSAQEFLGSSDDTLKKILTTLLSHIGKDARRPRTFMPPESYGQQDECQCGHQAPGLTRKRNQARVERQEEGQ